MKTFFSHRLFFVLYFLLVGVCSQDILVAMNADKKTVANGLGLQPVGLTRSDSLQSVETSRSLFSEFNVCIDEIDAQEICQDVLKRIEKRLAKNADKKKIRRRQIQISSALKKIYAQIQTDQGNVRIVPFILAIQNILKQQNLGTYTIKHASRFLRFKKPVSDEDFPELPIDKENGDAKESKDAKDSKSSDSKDDNTDDDIDGLSQKMGTLCLLPLPDAAIFKEQDKGTFCLLPAAAGFKRQVSFSDTSGETTPLTLSPEAHKPVKSGLGLSPRPVRSNDHTPVGSPLREKKRPALGASSTLSTPSTPSQLLKHGKVDIGSPGKYAKGDGKSSDRSKDTTPKSSPKKESKSPHRTPKKKVEEFSCTSELLEDHIIYSILGASRAGLVNHKLVQAFSPLLNIMFFLPSELAGQKGNRNTWDGKVKKLVRDGGEHELLCMVIFDNRATIIEFIQAIDLTTVDQKTVKAFFAKRIDQIKREITPTATRDGFTWKTRTLSPRTLDLIQSNGDVKAFSNFSKEVRAAFIQIAPEDLLDAQELLMFIFELYSWKKYYDQSTWELDNKAAQAECYQLLSSLDGEAGRLMHCNQLFESCQSPKNVRRLFFATTDDSEKDSCDCAILLAALKKHDADLVCLDVADYKKAEAIKRKEYEEIKKLMTYKGKDAMVPGTKWYKQDLTWFVARGIKLECDLKIPTAGPCASSIFSNPIILRDKHIFEITLDREDESKESKAASINGGHFARTSDLPFPVCPPVGLINDERAGYCDRVMGYCDITDLTPDQIRAWLGTRKITKIPGDILTQEAMPKNIDKAIRTGLWVIEKDQKFKASSKVTGGTMLCKKTMFPDCFRESFGTYAEGLYNLTRLVKTEHETKESSFAGKRVTVTLDKIETSEDKKVVKKMYMFTHPHFVGCLNQSCKFSKIGGIDTIIMYVREETLSPMHTVTTIMSMHPVIPITKKS